MNVLDLDKLYISRKYCTARRNEEPVHLLGHVIEEYYILTE